jgi:hypothetical protein
MGKNGTVSILAWKFYIGKKTFHTRMKCASSFYTSEFDFSFGTVCSESCILRRDPETSRK